MPLPARDIPWRKIKYGAKALVRKIKTKIGYGGKTIGYGNSTLGY